MMVREYLEEYACGLEVLLRLRTKACGEEVDGADGEVGE